MVRLEFFLGLIVLYFSCAESALPQCTSPANPLYVQCAKMKCSDGNRCECGCGSWCGYDTAAAFTNDTIPRCQIERQTPDVPENREILGNPCETSRCPFRPLQLYICPPGGRTYNFSGASCDKDPATGGCYWTLPECDPIPPPLGTACDKCSGAKPASLGTCGSSWPLNQVESSYNCEHDGAGKCVWTQKSCPSSGCPVGVQNPKACPEDMCSKWQSGKVTLQNCSYTPSANVLCENIFCGGCNFKLTANGAEVCPETYKTKEAITCNFGYTYSPEYPYCVSTQTCETTSCGYGEKCAYVWQFNGVQQYRPQCIKVSIPPSQYNCTNAVCSEGFTCENRPGSTPGFACVTKSGSCQASDCQNIPKKPCLETAVANSLTCQRSKSGLCEWSFAPCPDFTPTQAADCKVSNWTAWICSAPCGQWTKSYRNRTITQQPTSGGKPCPITFEIGQDCQGTNNCANGKPNVIVTPTNITYPPTGSNPGAVGGDQINNSGAVILQGTYLVFFLMFLFLSWL